MLVQSYVYNIHRFQPPNSNLDQLKVLGDTRTPFAVRRLLFNAEPHRIEYVARSKAADTTRTSGSRQPLAFTSQ